MLKMSVDTTTEWPNQLSDFVKRVVNLKKSYVPI